MVEPLKPANSTGPYLSSPSSLWWLMPSWTMKHLNRSQQCTKNSSRRLIPVAEQYLASLLTSAAFAFSTTAVPQPMGSYPGAPKTVCLQLAGAFPPLERQLAHHHGSSAPKALLFDGKPPRLAVSAWYQPDTDPACFWDLRWLVHFYSVFYPLGMLAPTTRITPRFS